MKALFVHTRIQVRFAHSNLPNRHVPYQVLTQMIPVSSAGQLFPELLFKMLHPCLSFGTQSKFNLVNDQTCVPENRQVGTEYSCFTSRLWLDISWPTDTWSAGPLSFTFRSRSTLWFIILHPQTDSSPASALRSDVIPASYLNHYDTQTTRFLQRRYSLFPILQLRLLRRLTLSATQLPSQPA